MAFVALQSVALQALSKKRSVEQFTLKESETYWSV